MKIRFGISACVILGTLGCTDHGFELRSKHPIAASDMRCIEKVISSTYKNVEIRTDPSRDSANSGVRQVRRIFFDQPDANGFYSEAETRNYSLSWTSTETIGGDVSFHWIKRGRAISAIEKKHVAERIEQVHRLLSTRCDMARSMLELVEN